MILNKTVLISPSIIAADLSILGSIVGEFDPSVVDLLHMDVMDGVYVPNLTIGPGYIENLKQHTSIPFDIHLMIEKPEDTIERYSAIAPWSLTIHYESTRFPARLLKAIREQGIRAGISINPATPVEMIYDLFPYIDIVLVMSVDPGFYGQSFMEMSVNRIRRLHARIVEEGWGDRIVIEVDGGITEDNIGQVVKAGARIFVAGSAAFKKGAVNENVKRLKGKALAVLT